MTREKTKIIVALSMNELLHLTSLAHLGFKKMMPNDRGFEMLRSAMRNRRLRNLVPSKTGAAIPEKHRLPARRQPSGIDRRWWSAERKTAVVRESRLASGSG